MSIPATESVAPTGIFGPTADPTKAAATTSTSKVGDKDMFLKLLVAQMKYQDPMNPTDSSQFLSQSAQFTSLEKMQAVADQTQQLVTSQMAFGASSLVGRTVSWTGSDGTAHSGTVDGVQFGSEGGPQLSVGGTSVALNQVQSVFGTAAAAAAAAAATAAAAGSTDASGSTGTAGPEGTPAPAAPAGTTV